MNGESSEFKQRVIEGIPIVKTLPRIIKKKFLFPILNSIHTYKPELAAGILGALYHDKEDNQPPISPWDKRSCDLAEAHLRELLGEEVFESAFAEGQKMSLEEALDLVLKSVEEMDE